ncbi:hypothetical protein [Clostridium sp. LIBA-8841]|uniref:hypothetical protein n=1 Tax=Clostridium sp. LIBA-8841 TaxID=2987530 RepID=UPI002AC643BE|nr:hypothetical protein [Clostridium sp. LIBA-8841]MDZ5253798.1 hypothetical protein [Clostridium sp. LIBA-8841]
MKDNSMIALIKYNLIKCYKKNVIILTFLAILIVCRVYMDSVSEYFVLSGKGINQWDYFFRIFSNGFLLTWLILPIMFLVTAPIANFQESNKYLFVRCKSKFKIFIGNQITNLLIITLYITAIGACVFVLGIYYSNFGSEWSQAILNEKNVDVLSKYLYFANFIKEYTPIKAMAISIFEFIIASYFLVLVRDVLLYIFKKSIIVTSICFIYIIINARSIVFLKLISTGYLGTIWCHKFTYSNNLSLNILDGMKLLTVGQENIVAISIICLLFLIGIIAFRRCDVEKV